jgi:hypothetical protein
MTQNPSPKTKGHWPKGKRRNADSGDWSRTLLLLRRLIEQHGRHGISYGALAVALAVHEKSVRRWRDGVNRPPVELQEAVAQWVADKRKEIRDFS